MNDRAGFAGTIFAVAILIVYGIYWYSVSSDCSAAGGVLVDGAYGLFECVEGKR